MPEIKSGCREYRCLTNRRGFLRVGAIGGLGLSLADALRQSSQAATPRTAKAKSVILLWLQGGVSHHETFDTKPDATADVRGEMVPITTNLPGVFIGEHLPRLATMMDKLAVIRSVTHSEAAHQRGSMYMVEGRRPPKATGVEASGHPHLGCIVGHELGMRNGVPPYVTNPGNDFTAKFVGPGSLPLSAAGFKGVNASSLKVGSGFSSDRFGGRVSLRDSLEAAGGNLTGSRTGRTWDQFDDQAIDIIASAKAAQAFDWQSESEDTKQLYGISRQGQMGSLSLTARRLVEAGVRFVTIGRNSWDHHSNMFPQLRSRLPRFDAAFAGLVTDLERRGMLDETLVVYLTEFGRTPKVNSQAGRDHWPGVFSVAFAGAGISTGQIIGASDQDGARPIEDPVSPEQIAATILHLVGIPPQSTYLGQDHRPHFYVDDAQPIASLLI